MNNKNQLKYRPCVGIVLFNKENKVFVGERIDTSGAWQMPQGGIDAGEDIIDAAMRELKEEIGTNNASIIKIADKKIRYDLPEHIIKKLWSGKYRGQEQTWVAMRFKGLDSDIDLNKFTPPEFRAWKWVSLEDTLKLIVPFKQDSYRQVINMFKDL